MIGATVATLAGAAAVAEGDRALRVIQTVPVRAPESVATLDYPWGQVAFIINVDATGRLVDYLVERSTAPGFTAAAEKALREWRFAPAWREGQAVGTRELLVIDFEPRGIVVNLRRDAFATRLFDRVARPRPEAQVSGPAELDAPLHVIASKSPQPIAPQPTRPSSGRVVLDFLVDPAGRPRMPVVLASPSDAHAASAVDALSQWRFSPPTRKGEPVAVRVRQEFVFPAEAS